MRVALNGAAGRFALDLAVGIERGSIVAIVGPSGAGKTTFLRLIAGLARPDAGRLCVDGEVWCDTGARLHLPTQRRRLGFVFQDYALFPNMTVRGNVEYALGRSASRGAADDLLGLVALERLQNAYPDRLSGGQKQRLALIRALARRPWLLLLDEPLSALDPVMRRQLQGELKRLHATFGTTTLIVSHDTSEILRLADRVLRLEEGRIVYDGTPVGALGIEEADAGISLVGEHVEGPDADGRARVLLDGRIRRVRYHAGVSPPAPGDLVVLRIDEVEAVRGGDHPMGVL
ncbi:ATP-binding cassette domain-containing protein [Xanthobacteraceae bacterium Astr-EGSB]|uniref:ABC transporter ATP-binding protein n=1 Tax=Astrobacterium formosum TaxID=3069710 RepID=UPI0027B225CF|nr:ATP-binding cassette domain-containing protein [Xanthobacteraceae bacterium Astr-EGSB]